MVLFRLKKIGPSGPIFRREPGLQRGRRRAPFARSRETSIHIKGTLWRTERVHRSGIYHPARAFSIMLDGGCALLTRPTILGRTLDVGWVSEAHPPCLRRNGEADFFSRSKTTNIGAAWFVGWVSEAHPLCLRRNGEADFFSRSKTTNIGVTWFVGWVSGAHPPCQFPTHRAI